MPDFITERDPVIHHVPVTTQHGPTEYRIALLELENAYKDFLDYVDACEKSGSFDYPTLEHRKQVCQRLEKRRDDLYDQYFG